MNNINSHETSNAEIFNRITSFWIDIYQSERIKNPDLKYRDILRLILKRIKKYCEINNYSYSEYQKYWIENKIHFWSLAKKKLSNFLLSSMKVINAEIVKLLTTPYDDESCLKLIELKHWVKLDKITNLTNKNIRNNNIDEIRKNSKSWGNKSTKVTWNTKSKKDKLFFINYNTINLNKLTSDEEAAINLICKRIITENIEYKNNKSLTSFMRTLKKAWNIRDDIVHFIATQCG